jgi:hypothetical protein
MGYYQQFNKAGNINRNNDDLRNKKANKVICKQGSWRQDFCADKQ